jgi:hypothetical protein
MDKMSRMMHERAQHRAKDQMSPADTKKMREKKPIDRRREVGSKDLYAN